jgi:DNA-binding CsgD family transcriptional regulator
MDSVSAALAVGTREKAGKRSRKNAKFLRDGAVIERERYALEKLRDGLTHQEIADDMHISRSSASNLIQRALKHRAEREGPAVEEARTLHVMRLEKMLLRWFPRATGDYLDEETGTSENPPDYRAADMTLKILNQLAEVQGTKKIMPVTTVPNPDAPDSSSGGLHVHFHHPAERQRAEASILEALRKASDKQNVIEGQLAAIGTSTAQLLGEVDHDKPGPPPVKP